MKLIFLLGNLGAEYRGTRHNVAWDIVDSSRIDWSEKLKFHAYIAEGHNTPERTLYVRPTTFYNEAGVALRAVIDFYKLDPSDVLVIHDDLMLPLGTVRTRIGGRDAGNNGLKSIAQHVGDDLARIRIGIATEHRQLSGDTNFVLGKFTTDEARLVDTMRPTIQTLIEQFIDGQFQTTTHRHDVA